MTERAATVAHLIPPHDPRRTRTTANDLARSHVGIFGKHHLTTYACSSPLAEIRHIHVLIGTLAAQYFGRRATSRDTREALEEQRRQLPSSLLRMAVIPIPGRYAPYSR
jgi:hypothetical protein